MTQDDLLRAAMTVGMTFELPPTKLFQFAALIAAHEREECAKIVDDWYNSLASEPEMAEIAAEIRGRKE